MTKYGNVRTQSFGRSFSSQGERDCFGYLTLLEKAGEIRDIECQVMVYLGQHRFKCVIDFKYFDVKRGETVWADFKGFETQKWGQIKKHWKFYGPGKLITWKGSGNRMRESQVVVPDDVSTALNAVEINDLKKDIACPQCGFEFDPRAV